MVTIKINGQAFEVEEEKRLIQVLIEKEFKVPHLCFHQALTPGASCKLCVVEVKEIKGTPRTRLSCVVKPREGMEIKTESVMVRHLRNEAIGHLLKLAPHADAIHKLGPEFGLTTGLKPDGCIRCRLCVRVCKEIIGAYALKLVLREDRSLVVPSEEGTCIGCGTCAKICPTGAILSEDVGNLRTIRIRDEIIGKHLLERCDICGRHYATERFLEYVKTSEGDHPGEKEPHHHCPACAKLSLKQKLRITAPKLAKTFGGIPVG